MEKTSANDNKQIKSGKEVDVNVKNSSKVVQPTLHDQDLEV